MEVKFVKRAEWGAEPPVSQQPFTNTPCDVQFCFSDVSGCKTKQACIRSVKKLQKKHLKKGLPDIAYNFLIGGDKKVYEGRGWNVQPSNTEEIINGGLSSEGALLVAYIGTFADNEKTPEIADIGHDLISYGFENGLLQEGIPSSDSSYRTHVEMI